MQHVFVVDAGHRPLMPCRPARARLLLTRGKAAVLRRFPFTIILHEAKPDTTVEPLRVKIDPGSKTTGLAVVNDTTGRVVWAAEVQHRGQQIHEHLDQRRMCRHSRRQRHTRYRAPRFLNRTRPTGWLLPSLQSRIQNVVTWVQRLRCWCPIAAISVEDVRFDMHLLQNPDISGIEYQHGTLYEKEIREYLLYKWNYHCAYCKEPSKWWEVDHILPRSRGGSDRPSNLVLSCQECNKTKDTQTAEEFGHPEVQAQAKAPLRDAAAVNSTRKALHQRLLAMDLPVETGSGSRTKWNRTERKLPKTHWVDAVCVGASTPEHVRRWRDVIPLVITAQGWQRRQMCLTDKYGFPRTSAKEASRVQGFKTGDIVKAVVPASSVKAGTYTGKVAVRASGSFNLTTAQGTIQGISHRHCRPIHRLDGYAYQKGERAFLPIP